jgi:hypothetical protein
MKRNLTYKALALVGLGILSVIGFGFGVGWTFLTGRTVDVAATSIPIGSYISLTQEQKSMLDIYRERLELIFDAVAAQKRRLNEAINPGLEQIYGKHADPVPGTFAEHERAYLSSTFYAQITDLQIELARRESETLVLAQKINDAKQQIFVANPGKQLDKPSNNAFNGLRHKVANTLSLIADVYNDDPPCPGCYP